VINLKTLSCDDKPCTIYRSTPDGTVMLGAISGDSYNWAGIPLEQLISELIELGIIASVFNAPVYYEPEEL
jgi:predicted house-cleaning NTP pyrophosphatase (Maf/HAM1 superfamily)